MNGKETMTLEQAIAAIKPLDTQAQQRAQYRWDHIAKPLNSLGLLEKALVQIAGITGSDKIDLSKRCVVVMCADNGVVEEGVTQTSSDVTAVVTENFTKGATSVCQMAQVAGAKVIPVDIGVANEVDGPGMVHAKIAWGTKNFVKEPAMTREEAVKALETGINLVASLKEEGYRIIATGEMGIGNTTTSSALAAVFCRRPVEEVTGRGAGLSSEGLNRKISAIKRGIALHQPDPEDGIDTLAKLGGLDIAGLAGVFLGGAACGVPILVDGFISAVSALTAVKICPAVAPYIMASHVSKEPAGHLLLDTLGLRPFLTCDMCLGEGTGAVAAMPILDMACAVYNDMSTFAETSIEEYKPLS